MLLTTIYRFLYADKHLSFLGMTFGAFFKKRGLNLLGFRKIKYKHIIW